MQIIYITMQIDKQLYEEINEYCKLNELKTRDFIHKILKDGFLKEKYGELPFIFKTQETYIEKGEEIIETSTIEIIRPLIAEKEEETPLEKEETHYQEEVLCQEEIKETSPVKIKKKRKLN